MSKNRVRASALSDAAADLRNFAKRSGGNANQVLWQGGYNITLSVKKAFLDEAPDEIKSGDRWPTSIYVRQKIRKQFVPWMRGKKFSIIRGPQLGVRAKSLYDKAVIAEKKRRRQSYKYLGATFPVKRLAFDNIPQSEGTHVIKRFKLGDQKKSIKDLPNKVVGKTQFKIRRSGAFSQTSQFRVESTAKAIGKVNRKKGDLVERGIRKNQNFLKGRKVGSAITKAHKQTMRRRYKS